MTVVALWYEESNGIMCAADTRVSRPGGRPPLTDSAPKILALTVTTHLTSDGDSRWRPHESRTFGFAFAGSTLAANSCFAMASMMCSMIGLKNARTSFPALATIAELVRHAAEIYVREIDTALAVCLFGQDPVSGDLMAYAIQQVPGSSPAKMSTELIPIGPDCAPFILGSGEARLRAVVAELAASFPVSFITYKPNMIEALWRLVKVEKPDEVGVGGCIQIASVDRDGLEYSAILEQETADATKFKVKLLGRSLPHLPEDDLQVAVRGTAPQWLGVDKVIRDARPKR